MCCELSQITAADRKLHKKMIKFDKGRDLFKTVKQWHNVHTHYTKKQKHIVYLKNRYFSSYNNYQARKIVKCIILQFHFLKFADLPPVYHSLVLQFNMQCEQD